MPTRNVTAVGEGAGVVVRFFDGAGFDVGRYRNGVVVGALPNVDGLELGIGAMTTVWATGGAGGTPPARNSGSPFF
ncbi:hypothetical protein L3i22_080130 [Actinoplanes sp. L3-i22]|nr:hypothetical protein L3i22_080130 [Actinoplanes sp. L3-i22]